MLERPRSTERYARGFAAAVAAVAALVLAANAGPARAAHPEPDRQPTAPVEAAVR
ncbi:hypothetical protein [Streptomyces griseoloalbus]|uniref:Uncharacterized protein n=1 Tax=Streptomyces griseoloalbus TaxID=67303 RepID=A0A7W8BWL1_9ACTN|nr:hypothetical protein [Streptomyces albaduncus]MBB5129761.1 hypothetical protein [Streptomyces albaduncus]GGV69448.1 hypothetical protein GCM10010294_26360 [Streptomyces griseoloalbus]GGW62584.1 hypothetical protein GCM10010340_46170 [Streptomyces albaduncus]